MTNKIPGELSELEKRFQQGRISRREFLRAAILLAASLGSGKLLSACQGNEPVSATPRWDPEFWEYSNDNPTQLPNPDRFKPAPTFTPRPEVEWVGKPTPTATPGVPWKPEWYCGACGAHFISRDMFLNHAAEAHTWRLPQVRQVDKPTYEQFIVGKVERFDERNTAFSRAAWDTDYQAQIQAAMAKTKKGGWEEFEGQALVAGAIYVDDAAGSLHPNYTGYTGHMKDTAGLYGWEDPVNPVKFPVEDPAWMSQRIKQVARFYGADLVGITQVDPRWVYSYTFERATGKHTRFKLRQKYAIVIGIEMKWEAIKKSPGLEASAAAALVYSNMAEVTAKLAKYIRALGYPALPSGNDSAQNIPLAIDAGLGELGRNGLLLTPEFGPRLRLCKVFTDLPLVPDQPIDFGIQKYCETCHACAKSCPVDAIQWGERTTEPTSICNRTGLLRWPVHTANCLLYWQENGTDCGNCVAACPWGIPHPRDWLDL